MGSEVRVHLRLGSLRLSYEGIQSFYEKHVETLVSAAAGRAASLRPTAPGAVGLEAAAVEHHATNGTAAPSAAPASDAAPPATERPKAERAAPAGFVPQSGEFGRF